MSEKQDQLFKLRKKLQKDNIEFLQTIEGLSVEKLDSNLLMYAKHQEDVKFALKNSKEINDLKEQLKELQGPYRDALKVLNLKTAFINLLINGGENEGTVDEQEAEK